MKYKKPSIDALLSAIEAEIWAGRGSENLAEHLDYIRLITRELQYRLYPLGQGAYQDRNGSVIEKILRKLEYE